MDVSMIIMLVVLIFLVALMALGYVRRKKFNDKLMLMRDNLKVGDKVMTDTGVVGEIVDKRTEGEFSFVTLKTGSGDHAGFMEVHVNAVYYTFDKDGNVDYAGQNQEETPVESTEKEDK
ncbi:MAG: preprotein translocase subunit YajC [Clostridia bacterium]|nr:preprotein translocase subunit YajC [Clostridia bacterium]